MKIFITGGTGFIGTALTRKLTEQGDQVTVLTRAIRADRTLPTGAIFVEGDPTQKGAWQQDVAEHDLVINLAGVSIFRRWTPEAKQAMRVSRVQTTLNLVEALSFRKDKDMVFLSTSAVGYYGFSGDEDLDESRSPGDGFLASLSREWEEAALKAQAKNVRVVLCRLGIVLGAAGGALEKMVPLFRRYLGSPLGDGRQWFSWIHEQDLMEIYRFLMSRKDISGPVNCTAPHPVTNRYMTQALAQAMGKPAFMPPVPGFMLKLLMGEFGSMLLKGQKVLPRKLLDSGFDFQFPHIKEALTDLVQEKG